MGVFWTFVGGLEESADDELSGREGEGEEERGAERGDG